jgi:hypothetical protein
MDGEVRHEAGLVGVAVGAAEAIAEEGWRALGVFGAAAAKGEPGWAAGIFVSTGRLNRAVNSEAGAAAGGEKSE